MMMKYSTIIKKPEKSPKKGVKDSGKKPQRKSRKASV